jgi:hypothetical protein
VRRRERGGCAVLRHRPRVGARTAARAQRNAGRDGHHSGQAGQDRSVLTLGLSHVAGGVRLFRGARRTRAHASDQV